MLLGESALTGQINMFEPSILLQLPDEILLSVIDFTSHGPDYGSHPECLQCAVDLAAEPWDRNSLVALSQVSRRLARLAQPILFRNIQVPYPYRTVPLTRPGIELHRTLTENPALRKHCR